MNFSTHYLGLELKNPIIIGSSPLTGTLEGVKSCAEAGAGAIVLKSLFEEQILNDIQKEKQQEYYQNDPEMLSYLSSYIKSNEIELYTDLIRKAKQSVDIPIIASINCTEAGEWVNIAKVFETAGADALELNIAIAPFDKHLTAQVVEEQMIEILRSVKQQVTLPISVKIGSYFTNLAHVVSRLVEAGAQGMVLFNRFYNSDIDIENCQVVAGDAFSVPEENSTTLRWLTLLHAQEIPCALSASTGIHSASTMIKQLLAGADTVQLCSVLFHQGLPIINTMLEEMAQWMQRHQFEKIDQFKGSVCTHPNIKMMERLQYLRRNNGER